MLRSMDSAVSGLRAHQNKLDVIGHNIANVNTNGFKSQNYTFKDTMYQTSTASTNGTNNAGGVNAAQYGYGALMGVISMDMTASTPTYKGGFNATIDGDGFFITNSARLDVNGMTGINDVERLKTNDFSFTRVGQFSVDSNGYIVDGNGNFVYGFRVQDGSAESQTTKMQVLRVPTAATQDRNGNFTEFEIGDLNLTGTGGAEALEALDIQINKMGDVQASLKIPYKTGKDKFGNNIYLDDGSFAPKRDQDGNIIAAGGNYTATDETTAYKTITMTIGQVAIATFQNQDGLTKDGNGYYKATESDNTGVCSASVAGDGRSTLMPGYLEASNVDMATEFAEMIMTQRGFQANSKIITVSDEILNDLINMKR